MKRLCATRRALVLVLALALPAAALGNDFRTPPPVPSTRDDLKPVVKKTSKAPDDSRESLANKKVITPAKPGAAKTKTPASLQ